jgi:two-component system nitrogen regulation sensor histidine kinase GlnL
VTIGLRRHRLAVRLEIIDNGPGIPPDIMDKMFLPMISGRAAGSGLGLSIAQAIVSQHQGTIECTSEPGRTRFAIMLPVEPAASEPPVEHTDER